MKEKTPDFFNNSSSSFSEHKLLSPLADRMRPTSIEDLLGQEHILSKGKPLRRIIELDRIPSMVFYGPPGVGKSSIVNIIASKTKSEYININAVLSSIADIRASSKKAESNLQMSGKKTILFIDEIHRFNKSQQDALLPVVENGLITLIGSTTQNPYFYLNNALLSRVMLFEFKPLSDEDIKKSLLHALEHDKILSEDKTEIEDGALELIIKSSLGDIRKALTYLEMAFLSLEILDDNASKPIITFDTVKEVVSRQNIQYDRDGDEHYNIISAFIKSVRGSDVDAALHYLARMIESGEDPRYIARRLVVLASEDIGLADPNAINIASSLVNIIDFIGMPEGRIPLSEVTIYLALSPKSNSAYLAIDKALEDIRAGNISAIPNYLKDRHSGSFSREENTDYKYPHDYPYHIVLQEYFYNKSKYYTPVDIGEEREIKKRYDWIDKHIHEKDK